MPLVRIAIRQGQAPGYRQVVTDGVHEALVETTKENWSFGRGEASYA